ncbi:hypothetical protein AWN88_14090 [Agrobacterium tumefaciens]|nr:hypothetical protein AWN88_14090 [Agrobacterium tumefaciens]
MPFVDFSLEIEWLQEIMGRLQDSKQRRGADVDGNLKIFRGATDCGRQYTAFHEIVQGPRKYLDFLQGFT